MAKGPPISEHSPAWSMSSLRAPYPTRPGTFRTQPLHTSAGVYRGTMLGRCVRLYRALLEPEAPTLDYLSPVEYEDQAKLA